ncbi:hypothetical protein ACH5RR_016534 [Cinchona calisaya]|uniref:3-oxo-5-alpha-steroid 4-dehydrogenase C-terminal domain-containing protein n=1 Tax=Cinchona calisaya TaxID=153742 RepID=A0ABD2ZW55_9GENT
MLPHILMRFVYPLPPSLFVSAISLISFASLTNAGFMEIKGKHMQYSKFLNVGSSSADKNIKAKKQLSSKTGMLIFYTPAFLAGLASFALFSDKGYLRFTLLRSALTIHFFKRIFEVLFIHKFSGGMDLEAAIIVSLSYFLSTVTMIYAQHLSKGLPEPLIDLKYVGILLFFMGISGSFYHHFLLSKLRSSKGDKLYKIPQGGLFGLVICPHYLFEVVGFVGVSCISQTFYALSFTFGTIFYLMGRSFATRSWYRSKFDDFPHNTKALIPYIF